MEYSEVSDPNGTWTVPRVVQGTGGSDIITRVPVAASYDYYSDRIVVMFVGWGSFNETGSLHIVSIPAGTPGGTWSNTVDLTGWSSVGPPAISCENTSYACNCQGLNTGTDAQRRLWDFGFALNTDGSLYKSCGYGTSGAETNFPPSISSGGVGGVGYFVEAHHGLDGHVYVRSKQVASDSWGPWTSILGSTGASGTPVRVSDYYGNYQVLHAPGP